MIIVWNFEGTIINITNKDRDTTIWIIINWIAFTTNDTFFVTLYKFYAEM
jgi:hypothetical protein